MSRIENDREPHEKHGGRQTERPVAKTFVREPSKHVQSPRRCRNILDDGTLELAGSPGLGGGRFELQRRHHIAVDVIRSLDKQRHVDKCLASAKNLRQEPPENPHGNQRERCKSHNALQRVHGERPVEGEQRNGRPDDHQQQRTQRRSPSHKGPPTPQTSKPRTQLSEFRFHWSGGQKGSLFYTRCRKARLPIGAKHRNATETNPSFNRKPKACAFGPNDVNSPKNACGPTCGRCPALG